MAISSLFAWRWSLKPVLAFMLLAAAAGAYFMLSYGVVIERTMMVNVLLTDTREARELLSWRMAGALALLGVLPVALLWRARMSWPSGLRQLRNNALTLVAALALAIVAMGLSFQDLSATMRNHTQLRYLINPLNSFYAIAIMGRKPIQRSGVAVAPLGEDAHLPALAAGARPPLVIMVLGETARADHLGLNGYARDTTPRLAQENVVSLRNVWSCGTNTAASVPCMFSNLGREAFENRQIAGRRLVQQTLEPAILAQSALVRQRIETLNHVEIRFGLAHHITHVDVFGVFQEPHATATSACGLQQALGAQLVNDFGQVAARHGMTFGNFRDRDRLLTPLMGRAVHQYAQRVVSPLGQPHG